MPPSKLKQVQFQFAGHIRDPEGLPRPDDVEERRMAIYRDLFFNNIAGFIANNFPVLKQLYDDQAWLALVRDFMVHHRAHTPLFPEIGREFLQFIEQQRGLQRGDPPFMLELAHYEWMELAVGLDEAEIDQVDADPQGDLLGSSPVLSPLAQLVSYQYPVHRIRPDFQPQHPSAEPTHLVVYRNRDDQVRFMVLNPVSARLLQLLSQQPGRAGRDYLSAIADELGHSAPDTVVTAGAQVLSELLQRDIILGSRALVH